MPEQIALSAPRAWPILAALAFLAAMALSAVLTPLSARLGAALGMIDDPTADRKVHTAPTPRSGGIAVAFSFYGVLIGGLLAAPFALPLLPFVGDAAREGALPFLGNVGLVARPLAAILVGSLVMFLLGVVDDRRPLSPGVKLVAQVAAAAGLWFAGVEARAFLPDPISLLLTIAWIVAICNAMNLLDNMNGLSSGVAVIAGFGFAWQSWLSGEWLMMGAWAALCGSIAGFWFWNFTRGRPFLGDGGSLFIGFMLGALALRATYYEQGVASALPVFTPLILLGVPIFDTATVMLIRLREGRPLMVGDRCHLSHRLTDLGFTQRQAVVFHYLLCIALVLMAAALRYLPPMPALALLAAVVVLFALLFLIEQAGAAAAKVRSDAGQ